MLLAIATKRALIIDWRKFRGEDIFISSGANRTEIKKNEVPASLTDLFHNPCFEWSYEDAPWEIHNFRESKVHLRYDFGDAFRKLFTVPGDPWPDRLVLTVISPLDFSMAVLSNPSYNWLSDLFPRDNVTQYYKYQMPAPLTFITRYLFSPNIENYNDSVKNEYSNMQSEINQKCYNSKYYGLHHRIPTLAVEKKDRAHKYFPCLNSLFMALNHSCIFLSSDLVSRSDIIKQLPKSTQLFEFNHTRNRLSREGIEMGVIELFTLGSSWMLFSSVPTNYLDMASNIQGIQRYDKNCNISQSSASGHICAIRKIQIRGSYRYINPLDRGFDLRSRYGCNLDHNPIDYTSMLSFDDVVTNDYSPIINGCIVYLLNEKDILNLISSVKLLETNFFSIVGIKYPVFIFVQNLNEKSKELLNLLNSTVVINIVNLPEWTLPNSTNKNISTIISPQINNYTNNNTNLISNNKNLSNSAINHVHRFLSGVMINHPILMKYEYLMRLDSDSYFPKSVKLDPFARMVDHGLNYGYLIEETNGNQVKKDNKNQNGKYESGKENEIENEKKSLKNLEYYMKEFINIYDIRPINLHSILSSNGNLISKSYYNNFEILRLPFFRNSGYIDFFNFLDENNLFFTEGWSDSQIRHLGVSLFASPQTVHTFVNFLSYQHQSYIN